MQRELAVFFIKAKVSAFVFAIPGHTCKQAQAQMALTFVGPCIVIYFYSKTNQMHNFSNLFYFGTTLYMFLTVFTSIIRSLRLYIQHQVYVIQVLWLLAGVSSHRTYMTYTWCCMYSLRLLMVDGETVRNT